MTVVACDSRHAAIDGYPSIDIPLLPTPVGQRLGLHCARTCPTPPQPARSIRSPVDEHKVGVGKFACMGNCSCNLQTLSGEGVQVGRLRGCCCS